MSTGDTEGEWIPENATVSDDEGATRPDLSTVPDLSDLPSDLPADVVLAVFGFAQAPTQFWPSAMVPQSWQECRYCHRELVTPTPTEELPHEQFRFLGQRCQTQLLERAAQLSALMHVHPLRILDGLFAIVRNLEAEERVRMRTHSYVTPRLGPEPGLGQSRQRVTTAPIHPSRRHV